MQPVFRVTRHLTPGTEYVLNCASADRTVYKNILTTSSELRATEQRLRHLFPYAPYLLEDFFHAFYQPSVHVNVNVTPTLHKHASIIGQLMATPTYHKARQETVGDSHAATMVIITVVTHLVEHLSAQKKKQKHHHSVNVPVSSARAGLLLPSWLSPHRTTASSMSDTPNVDTDTENHESDDTLLTQYAVVHAAELGAESLTHLNQIRATWGLFPGRWENYAIDEVWTTMHNLSNLPDFAALTQLIAELRELASHHGRHPRQAQLPHNITGVAPGRDLEHLVPLELVKLADTDLEELFHDAYENQSLVHYRMRGTQPETAPPLICCIDTSASMNQPAARDMSRLTWAKAVALALLSVATNQHRTYQAFCFAAAKQLISFQAPNGRLSAQDTLHLAQCQFGGGTHLETPLEAVVNFIDSSQAHKADVVMITDGDAPLDTQYVQNFRHDQQKWGIRLYTMFIDGQHLQLDTLSRAAFHVASTDESTWRNALQGINKRLRAE